MAASTTHTSTDRSTGSVNNTNVMAILALVFAFVFSPLGIVFGVIAKRQIRETGEQGTGLAKAGFWLGLVFTVLGVAWFALVFTVALSQGTTG